MTIDDISQTQTDQIPTDFQAFLDKRSRRSGQRKRRGIKLFRGAGTLPSDDHVLDFAHGYYDADPVAEAFVQDAYIEGNSSHGRAMLDQALAHGIESVPDAPASMVRLFEEFEKDPPWVDHDLVERGAFLFRRFGPSVFSFLGVATLLAYTENPIVQPLSMTGKYAGDAALNRFMETARFWIDVSDPGGTNSGAPGRATAMRVRIMHVFLRQRITRHPQWNLAAWGKPINQAEATITLLAGGFGAGLGMHKLGYRSTKADIRAMMHFWRYVGHLMGVQPRWYPADLREAAQLMTLYFAKRTFGAGDDGRELIESYPRAFTPKQGTDPRKAIRDKFNYRIQLGYTRYFLPGQFYRSYDMPNPWPWALLPLLQIPVNLTVDL
ncbi:MAG: hypothetical protein QOG75_5434, partial [Mycobacterium sp.]|nr:hypothetical protein [Mycobacterium sp.]